MIFGHFLRDLYKRLPEWDRSSRLSLYVAVILLALLLLAGFVGPDAIKLPARLGAFGLLLTLQLVVLWGNRRAISPYHEAQQHYIRGEYESARDLLEPVPEDQRESVDALALLGNCYRQLGQFDLAGLAIDRALQIKPDYHYALYAAGKLSQVSGDYHDARAYFEGALAVGTPDLVHFDLGQVCYYLGSADAEAHLRKFQAASLDEPAKAVMATYYLMAISKTGTWAPLLTQEVTTYWLDEAKRYQQTEYGKRLLVDIERLQELLQPQ
ncbi:MAG: tetratricopeptide repeat protein [Chloroflexi bacterium]|nr:tetratricopeptide repeat protein [Chloroflexota bacterium]